MVETSMWLWIGVGAVALTGALTAWGADARPASRPATDNKTLDDVRAWFATEGPAADVASRLRKMAVIQAAADELSPETFREYEDSWSKDAARAEALDATGVLHYLRAATTQAMTDIRRTKVKKGLVAWHLYNMGYVFKTPDACFAIDLHFRDAQLLAGDLDFLLVTHQHRDHVSVELIDAMIRAAKPVVTSFHPGSRIVAAGAALATQPATAPGADMRFGPVRVKVDIGDHNPREGLNAMLMYQIDCGPAGGNATIYHSGDGCNLAKMHPDREVSILIVHTEVGLNVPAAIDQIKPRMTFNSHVLELAHSTKPPQPWRWSFEHAYAKLKNIPPERATVLTWGERWLLPGTELDQKP